MRPAPRCAAECRCVCHAEPDVPRAQVTNYRSQAIRDYAARLRRNPGHWFPWPTPIGWTTARGYASAINLSNAHAPLVLRTGEFEAESRAGDLWVRLRPTDSQEAR